MSRHTTERALKSATGTMTILIAPIGTFTYRVTLGRDAYHITFEMTKEEMVVFSTALWRAEQSRAQEA